MSRRESDGTDHELHEFFARRCQPPRLPHPLRARRRRTRARRRLPRLVRRQGGARRRAGAAAGGGGSQTLRISNWPLYIDKQTVPDFEKATGIEVEYTEDINDNNEFFAKIDEPLKRNQSIDRDIIVLTDWMAGRLIRLGYAAPLDDAKFPNKANLVDEREGRELRPGRKYSVPWLSGMTAIGLQPEEDRRELTSVNDIFDPKFKGQVTMLTEMRDTVGLVMLGHGQGPAPATSRTRRPRRQDQEGARERADPQVHRQRLRGRPGGGQHRGRVRLVGRHPGARGRQPGPPVDRAQGGRHALLRQHADPEDLGPAGPRRWRGSTTSTTRSIRPRSWPACRTSRR